MSQEAFRINVAETFEPVTCANCGVRFCITEQYEKQRREDKVSFSCPNGHTQWFPGKTDADKVRDLLDAEKKRHQITLDRLNIEMQVRQKAERQLKRVKHGVCPCCKRTFKQLAAHMKT